MIIHKDKKVPQITIVISLRNYKTVNCIDLKTKLQFLTKVNSPFIYQLIVIFYDCDQVVENLVTSLLTDQELVYCQSIFLINVYSEDDINIYHNLLNRYIYGQYVQFLNPCVSFSKNYFQLLSEFFQNNSQKYDIVEFSSLIKSNHITFSFDIHHDISLEKVYSTFKQQLLIILSPFISNKIFRVNFFEKYQLLHHFYSNNQKLFFLYCVLKLSETFKIIPKILVTHNFFYSKESLYYSNKFQNKIKNLEKLAAYFVYMGELYVYQQEIEYMVVRDLLAFLLIQFSVYYLPNKPKSLYPLKKNFEILNSFIKLYFPNYSHNYYVEKYLDKNMFLNNFLDFSNFSKFFKEIYQNSR